MKNIIITFNNGKTFHHHYENNNTIIKEYLKDKHGIYHLTDIHHFVESGIKETNMRNNL